MFILTIATIWTVAVLTPGPSFLLLVKIALSGSRRVAAFATAGTVTGAVCWGLAGWLGIGALFTVAPVAYATLKVAGGLYLIWLGLRLLWQTRISAQTIHATQKSELSPLSAWRLGLITNLANPKSALFVASLFAATMSPDTPWVHGIVAVAVMATISTIWYGGLVIALGHQRVAQAYQRARRLIDVISGLIFVGFGFKLVLSDR